jgi:hypothetical protein
MKRFLLIAMLTLSILVPSTVQAQGKSPQNFICHWGTEDRNGDGVIDLGEGHYVLIKVSAKGAANHLKNHVGREGLPDDFTGSKGLDCNAAA